MLQLQRPLRKSETGGWSLVSPIVMPRRRVRVFRDGRSLQIGVDTNNDGSLDMILSATADAPRQLMRWWQRVLIRVVEQLLGWVPVNALVRALLRWLAVNADRTQLSVMLQICTGALALAELREDVQAACSDDGCPVELKDSLNAAVVATESALNTALDGVLKELDSDGDGKVSLSEAAALLAGTELAFAGTPGIAAAVNPRQRKLLSVIEAAGRGKAIAQQAQLKAEEAFTAIDTDNDGQISFDEALAAVRGVAGAAPDRLAAWWSQLRRTGSS